MSAVSRFARAAMAPGSHGAAASAGLLALRAGVGLLMLTQHGWGKLLRFSERSGSFPDPIGLGSTASLSLVTFAEVFCSCALLVGLFTRAAALPPLIAMGVAALIHHGGAPWAERELPLLYLSAYAALLALGAGRYSADAVLRPRR